MPADTSLDFPIHVQSSIDTSISFETYRSGESRSKESRSKDSRSHDSKKRSKSKDSKKSSRDRERSRSRDRDGRPISASESSPKKKTIKINKRRYEERDSYADEIHSYAKYRKYTDEKDKAKQEADEIRKLADPDYGKKRKKSNTVDSQKQPLLGISPVEKPPLLDRPPQTQSSFVDRSQVKLSQLQGQGTVANDTYRKQKSGPWPHNPADPWPEGKRPGRRERAKLRGHKVPEMHWRERLMLTESQDFEDRKRINFQQPWRPTVSEIAIEEDRKNRAFATYDLYKSKYPEDKIETNEKTIIQRQKHVDYGKNQEVYCKYLSTIPDKKLRKEKDPWTPDKYMKSSTRIWDGSIKSWKKKLHLWEAEFEKAQAKLRTEDYDDDARWEILEEQLLPAMSEPDIKNEPEPSSMPVEGKAPPISINPAFKNLNSSQNITQPQVSSSSFAPKPSAFKIFNYSDYLPQSASNDSMYEVQPFQVEDPNYGVQPFEAPSWEESVSNDYSADLR